MLTESVKHEKLLDRPANSHACTASRDTHASALAGRHAAAESRIADAATTTESCLEICSAAAVAASSTIPLITNHHVMLPHSKLGARRCVGQGPLLQRDHQSADRMTRGRAGKARARLGQRHQRSEAKAHCAGEFDTDRDRQLAPDVVVLLEELWMRLPRANWSCSWGDK